jgi:DNA-binding CsgD family transcriptional regulator
MRDMGGVGQHVRALRSVVLGCQAGTTTTPMPEPVFPALRELIGFDSAGFLGMDSRTALQYLFQDYDCGCDPSVLSPEDEVALWVEHETTDVCPHLPVPDDVVSILNETDGESVRQWHACQLYNELFKPSGNEHHLILRIPDGAGRTIRLLCWRGPGSRFGEREKTDLLLLLPHIEAAYRRGQRLRAVSALTPRQRELVELVGQGLTNYQIARRLGIAEGTVRAHLNQIYSRLRVSSRTAAVTRSLVAVQY